MPRKSTEQRLAEEAAARDRILAAHLENDRSKRMATEPPESTILSNFDAAVKAIVNAKRDSRLSEPTLVKLWELNLGWALSQRGNGIPTQTYEGGGPEEEDEPNDEPIPIHERITEETE